VIINCKESSSVLPGVLVNAYPNPVSTSLTVELEAQNSGSYVLEMVDLSGRVVLSDNMNTVSGLNKTSVDVSTLAKGMYLLTIKDAAGFVQQIRVAVE
jgi:hypothetical protein